LSGKPNRFQKEKLKMTRPIKKTGWMQGIIAESSTKKEALGTLRITRDGRKFRYAKAGTSALSAGKAGQMKAAAANHVNIAVASNVAIGDTQMTVTLGATAASENDYEDGYLHVNDATGEGYQIPISGNSAGASAGSCVITLDDPMPVALVAGTSQVTLVPNPWNGVTETTTEEAGFAGVAARAVTASYYYWSQTGGQAIALASGTGAVGSNVTFGAAAGSLLVLSTTIAETVVQPIVGYLNAIVQVDTEYKPVFLTAD